MRRRPPVTVVVPCRDRAELLRGCLDRLAAGLGPDDEVVVVDSASRDASVAAVAAEFGVRVVRCERAGASRARNAGWRAASHDFVLFTDDDMRATAGWCDALGAAVAAPGVGFAAGRSDPSPDAPAVVGVPAAVTRVVPPDVIGYGAPGVHGASNNLALPVRVLAEVGGFDERLGPGTWFAAGEDVELMDRVLATGRPGRYVAAARAHHEQWRGRSQARRLQLAYGKGMGARLALLARRDPATALRLRGELLRLGGLRTLLRRTRRTSGGSGPRAAAGPDETGVIGPLLWRCGAVTGLAVGLVVLRPARAAGQPGPVVEGQGRTVAASPAGDE